MTDRTFSCDGPATQTFRSTVSIDRARFPILACALALGVTLGVLLAAAGDAGAGSAAKACRKSCKQALKACRAEVRAGLAAACPNTGGERKRCRKQQKPIVQAGKRTCRTFRAECLTCCLAGGVSCEQPPDLPRASGEFPAPDRGALERTGLPVAADGSGVVILALPDGDVTFDPTDRTPISATGECANAMLACFHPPERNIAGCFAVVPVCETDTPWVGSAPMCCGARCAERYQTLRRAGLVAPAAFAAAIWEAPSCMPGFAGRPPAARRP